MEMNMNIKTHTNWGKKKHEKSEKENLIMKCADCTFMVQKTPSLSQLNLFPFSPTELNHPAVTRCLPLTANELVAAPLHPILSFFLF